MYVASHVVRIGINKTKGLKKCAVHCETHVNYLRPLVSPILLPVFEDPFVPELPLGGHHRLAAFLFP